ncbi:MAG: hypothetical protein AAF533_30310 [Acidobacteriota bacterium]
MNSTCSRHHRLGSDHDLVIRPSGSSRSHVMTHASLVQLLRLSLSRAAVALTILVFGTSAHAQVQSRDFVLQSLPGEHANLYFISLPDVPSFEDRANSSQDDPCDLSATTPDGVINVDDAICAMWGGGEREAQVGTFQVATVDPETCRWMERKLVRIGSLAYRSGPAFDLIAGIGYAVQVPYDPRIGVTEHRFTLSGPCEPGFTGRDLGALCPDAAAITTLLHVPYDTTLDDSVDIYCGLDWDVGGGVVDCDDGIYELAGHYIMQRYVNAIPAFQYSNITGFAGDALLPQPPFDLSPGESALLTLEPGASPRFYASRPDGIVCP